MPLVLGVPLNNASYYVTIMGYIGPLTLTHNPSPFVH